VTLTFCTDLAAADWIVRSDLSWPQLVSVGPPGSDAYARLRFLPDPVRPDQSENDVEADGGTDQLPRLWDVLATHTTTPDRCYFCVWEGFGVAESAPDHDAVYIHDENARVPLGTADARPGLAPEPTASASMLPVPKVVLPNRAYWLFRGPLARVGAWDTARAWPGQHRLDEVDPAFAWPADHAWCVALDVDSHWAGIGGTTRLIEELVADPRLDVVPADPSQELPFYR
jgi:hypothetical protein